MAKKKLNRKAYGPKPMKRRTYIFEYGDKGWILGRVNYVSPIHDNYEECTRQCGWSVSVEPMYIYGEFEYNTYTLDTKVRRPKNFIITLYYAPPKWLTRYGHDLYRWHKIDVNDETEMSMYALLGDEYITDETPIEIEEPSSWATWR